MELSRAVWVFLVPLVIVDCGELIFVEVLLLSTDERVGLVVDGDGLVDRKDDEEHIGQYSTAPSQDCLVTVLIPEVEPLSRQQRDLVLILDQVLELLHGSLFMCI